MDDRRYTEVYLPKYRGTIEALARKVARRNQELYEDLVQIGLIALWQADPARATQNEDAWIRQLLRNKMVSEYRRERRRASESLEVMLERGSQIAENEAGEPQMISPRGGRRQRPEYDASTEGEE